MSKIALVRRNGSVDVYEKHEDTYWGRVWFTPVQDVETIAPQPTGAVAVGAAVVVTVISIVVAVLL